MAREYECSECGFMVRSENEDEVIDVIQRHARETHDIEMKEKDIQDNWKRV